MRSATRRELLATFLGVPAALAAGSAARRAKPAARIVGANEALGHRLRDATRPVPPPDAWSTVPVLVVGGGVAGLAAAWRLRRANFHDFILIELEQAPGGTARS